MHRLVIIPIGLTFERKDAPRTRVHAQVGEPIEVDAWSENGDAVAALTAEIERRLRAVTLNFESVDDAARATALASLLARLFSSADAAPPVQTARAPLATQVAITRRIEEARTRLTHAPDAVRSRVDALLHRLADFDRERRDRRLAIEDLRITLDVPSGTWFVLREAPILLIAGPFALWGWLNHTLPFNLARLVAGRSVESAADPAMRTIVSGLALVLLFYAAQGAVVFGLFGGVGAAAYILSLPVTAEVNLAFRARLARVWRRARAYLLFRRDPALRARLENELRWLRDEAAAIDETLLGGVEAAASASHDQ